MTSTHAGAERVLESNRALRLWAAGLRSWSTAARAASSAERHRAEDIRAQLPAGRRQVPDLRRASPERQGRTAGPVLPSLGDVHVDELLSVLVRRHGFGAVGAVRALQISLLMAGYPPDSDDVLAADTWEILDTALRCAR